LAKRKQTQTACRIIIGGRRWRRYEISIIVAACRCSRFQSTYPDKDAAAVVDFENAMVFDFDRPQL
jgi:hypothetical protein